eukprot:scaffold193993_cov35-Tisochrysis_lutea.AAC.4
MLEFSEFDFQSPHSHLSLTERVSRLLNQTRELLTAPEVGLPLASRSSLTLSARIVRRSRSPGTYRRNWHVNPRELAAHRTPEPICDSRLAIYHRRGGSAGL